MPVGERQSDFSGAVTGENLANAPRQILALDRDLRRRPLGPFGAAFDLAGQFGAERHVFQRHFALGAFVAAFDDDDRRGALVGIFELRPHAALPEIELGANANRHATR